MKLNLSKARIAYGVISGFVYATVISVFDHFQDKPFNFKKFVIGVIVFGIAMMIAFSFKNKKR